MQGGTGGTFRGHRGVFPANTPQVRLGEQLGAVRLGRQLPSRVPCEQNEGGNVPHRLRVDDEPDSRVQLDGHGLA